ncbi:MAG: enoyl-CoA hydratase/isomerase [Marmoricola sp.]|nr:enoyl-CoA hydratase/isomerase [Marmoricola sp.]
MPTTQPPDLETVSVELIDDDVAVLRTDRPDRMNAQAVRTFGEYAEAARWLHDQPIRALLLTGRGDRAFCAGFDLAEIDVLTTMGTLEFLAFQEVATNAIQAVRALPYPVVAAIHGPATGGGLSLALAADIRLVAPTAKLSTAFVKVGLSFGELGVSWHLSRLVGPAKAAEIGYTARLVGAEEAVRIGLANRMVPGEDLYDEAVALTRTIAAQPPAAIRLAKRTLQRCTEIPSYAAALELEVRAATVLALDR